MRSSPLLVFLACASLAGCGLGSTGKTAIAGISLSTVGGGILLYDACAGEGPCEADKFSEHGKVSGGIILGIGAIALAAALVMAICEQTGPDGRKPCE